MRICRYHQNQQHTTTPPRPPQKHLEASPEAVSCILTHTHTHTYTYTHTYIHTHTCRVKQPFLFSHLFKTPNTFAHISTDVCFHQQKQVRFVEQSGLQRRGIIPEKPGETSVMMLRSASAPRGWLTDGLTAVGRAGVAPPTDTLRGLPPTKPRFKNNLLYKYLRHRSAQVIQTAALELIKQPSLAPHVRRSVNAIVCPCVKLAAEDHLTLPHLGRLTSAFQSQYIHTTWSRSQFKSYLHSQRTAI